MFFMKDFWYVVPFQLFISAGIFYFKDMIKEENSRPTVFSYPSSSEWKIGNVIYNTINDERSTILLLVYANWVFLTVMATRRQLELRRRLRIFPSELFIIVKAFEGRRKAVKDNGIDFSDLIKSLQVKLDKMQNPKLNMSQEDEENQSGDLDLEKGGIVEKWNNRKSRSIGKSERIWQFRPALFYILSFVCAALFMLMVFTIADWLMGKDPRYSLISWDAEKIQVASIFLIFPWTAWVYTIHSYNRSTLDRIMKRQQKQQQQQNRRQKEVNAKAKAEAEEDVKEDTN